MLGAGLLLMLLCLLAASPAHAQPARISGFPEAAPEFAKFLQQLPHGDEMGSLTVRIAAPEDVPRLCGNAGMTACYVVRSKTMIVPGPRLRPELIAHEYGHHLAAHRPGGRFGPVHWSSHQRVCAGVLTGRLGRRWADEPAEAWADVYARLAFPELGWRLSPLLRPSDLAYAAALRDVNDLYEPAARHFRGRFGEGGSGRRRFVLPLRLDGTIDLRLSAAEAMRLDLRVLSAGRRIAFTPARALRFGVCRSRAVERVTIEVRRRSGTGAFTLRARYPG